MYIYIYIYTHMYMGFHSHGAIPIAGWITMDNPQVDDKDIVARF